MLQAHFLTFWWDEERNAEIMINIMIFVELLPSMQYLENNTFLGACGSTVIYTSTNTIFVERPNSLNFWQPHSVHEALRWFAIHL